MGLIITETLCNFIEVCRGCIKEKSTIDISLKLLFFLWMYEALFAPIQSKSQMQQCHTTSFPTDMQATCIILNQMLLSNSVDSFITNSLRNSASIQNIEVLISYRSWKLQNVLLTPVSANWKDMDQHECPLQWSKSLLDCKQPSQSNFHHVWIFLPENLFCSIGNAGTRQKKTADDYNWGWRRSTLKSKSNEQTYPGWPVTQIILCTINCHTKKQLMVIPLACCFFFYGLNIESLSAINCMAIWMFFFA